MFVIIYFYGGKNLKNLNIIDENIQMISFSFYKYF